MVIFGSFDDFQDLSDKQNIDEVWLIVRRLKPYDNVNSIIIKHVPLLAPSDDLLNWTLQQKRKCIWDKEQFEQEYRPRFLSELATRGPKVREMLKYLAEISNATDKTIYVACYCKTDITCHRRIIEQLVTKLRTRI